MTSAENEILESVKLICECKKHTNKIIEEHGAIIALKEGYSFPTGIEAYKHHLLVRYPFLDEYIDQLDNEDLMAFISEESNADEYFKEVDTIKIQSMKKIIEQQRG